MKSKSKISSLDLARRWAREIIVPTQGHVLELRDPNSGQASEDPAARPRHQYLVARGRLWHRHLPPAPLDRPEDEAPWQDAPLRWELVPPNTSWVWEWATEKGVCPYPVQPVQVEGEWDLHGDGEPATVGYHMPARDPRDHWADITSYADEAPVPCPVCGQDLVWYEAGYVPGYRVCMSGGDPATIRHRWLHTRDVLVLDG